MNTKKNFHPYTKHILIASALLLVPFFMSCTLHYQDTEAAQESIPEFTFTNASYTSYEKNKKTVELSAARIEQFNYLNYAFVQDATFSSWNDKGNIETTGSCQYLSLDTKNEVYSLYNNIFLDNLTNELKIQADALKWNQTTEQLTSDKNSTVVIQKNDITITGQGFSASGISHSFTFSSKVLGSFTESKNEEETAPTNEVAEAKEAEQ